ncbi:hypothetical protein KAW48_05935 [candidate division WOR-3 bacterium]|nr:hypothetical protein [candidate division WOR-3 bacterium]
MKRCMLILLLSLTILVFAEEFPCVPGTETTPRTTPVKSDRVEEEPFIISEPVWKGLERMNQEERENSEISLILEKEASDQALQMAQRIENLWNSGEFEEALLLFPELEPLTDINEMAIGNAWRTPVPTEYESRWGDDVRIGNRDSVLVNVLDIHRATGNLFTILLLQGDGNTNRWDVYHSTDSGVTWSETYDWWANYQINSLSATVVTSHCYVAYLGNSSQNSARIRRFKTTDGTVDNFPDGSSWIQVFTTTSPDSIQEVAITSNQDFWNNRLYYLAITNQGSLIYYWDTQDAISWDEVLTGIGNADRGLDASCNEGFAEYFLLASYIDTDNVLHMVGRKSAKLKASESGASGFADKH